MSVEVFAADEQSAHAVDTLRWVRLARSVLVAEGVKGEAELSLLFVDEQAMSDLNKRFAGKEGPTDVLAFPIDEEPAEGGRSPDSGGSGPGWVPVEPSELATLLGDVVICPTVALRNAAGAGTPADDEMALLVVHGILHLMGMDHLDDEEAEVMERREQELLGQFHRSPTGSAPS
ncbi:MAG: rRNA maturation RNase YbeY [Acidimicrobiales bacterium]